jgi:hypothetical protein
MAKKMHGATISAFLQARNRSMRTNCGVYTLEKMA